MLQFNRWKALTSAYCRDEALVGNLFREIRTAYGEPNRFYHTAGHIEQMLRFSDQFADQIKSRDVVDFSIYYHDIIYVPGRGDNEYRSALAAEQALQMLGGGQEIIAGVRHFINATKTHQLQPDAPSDLKFFMDFDLAILAAEREAYRNYCSNVRKEFAYMSDVHFALGRTAFLQAMLKQPSIFHTEEFRGREGEARENMLWEIEHLRHI